MKNWPEENGQLVKEFELKDFLRSVEFINRIATVAEEMDHHPDLFLHSYKKVKISLMTHSEGMITELDHELAEKIDSIYNSL